MVTDSDTDNFLVLPFAARGVFQPMFPLATAPFTLSQGVQQRRHVAIVPPKRRRRQCAEQSQSLGDDRRVSARVLEKEKRAARRSIMERLVAQQPVIQHWTLVQPQCNAWTQADECPQVGQELCVGGVAGAERADDQNDNVHDLGHGTHLCCLRLNRIGKIGCAVIQQGLDG